MLATSTLEPATRECGQRYLPGVLHGSECHRAQANYTVVVRVAVVDERDIRSNHRHTDFQLVEPHAPST